MKFVYLHVVVSGIAELYVQEFLMKVIQYMPKLKVVWTGIITKIFSKFCKIVLFI